MKEPRGMRAASCALGIVMLLLWASCTQPPAVRAIAQAEAFLTSIQRADGAICDTTNPLFDTWETVEAATALWEIHHDTSLPSLSKALHFLRSQEHPDGLLCHNVKCRQQTCLETTAEYLILLAAIHGPQAIQPRMAAISPLQHPSGEWPILNPDVRESQTFPSVTAFVLGAYAAAQVQPTAPDSAWHWLRAQQLPDGTWGQHWEYYGCPTYALWPVLRALPATDPAAARATAYLLAAQAPDGSWDATEAAGPAQHQGQAKAKHVSPSLQTALAVAALQQSRESAAAVAAQRGIDYLLAHQEPRGHWDGGHFPIPNARYNKEEYVFATARAIIVLARHLASTHSTS